MSRNKSMSLLLYNDGFSDRPVEIDSLRKNFYDIKCVDSQGREHVSFAVSKEEIRREVKLFAKKYRPEEIVLYNETYLFDQNLNKAGARL